jgi:hypothetical protein
MRKSWAIASLLVLVAIPAMAQTPALRDIVPIPLHSGVNLIPAFTPDGRTGMIVLGWRDNGNAHSFDIAMVMIQNKPHDPWNVARVEGNPKNPNTDFGTDIVTDDPHTGEDIVRVFRFARGRLDEKPVTLLLIANRDVAGSIPAPSRVTFDTYVLEHDPEVGTTADHFTQIGEENTTSLFCNADVALSERFGLSFRGGPPSSPNGC